MLSLKNIVKEYVAGDSTVTALKGVSVDFREHEFVSILGPSGCGKTTLLNIIGGLDQYTSGDLVISGKSTRDFRDADWDTYRNHSIGFVFQSYNLIPHQSVLSNVELALTLSGVSKSERRRRAKEALEKVGLSDQLHKRPNQMSGGQMQRVAIARALVNDPEILLADEPTGALDSETSVQIMNILKDISADKLIIMVTHNPELAAQYSSRIIRLLDGNLLDDTQPYRETPEELALRRLEAQEKTKNKKQKKKTSMSLFTALSLSMNNLMTKRGRTLLTSFAGSIGIIGIALILSISTGVQTYIDRVQEDTLASYPITLEAETVDMSSLVQTLMNTDEEEEEEAEEHELDRVYTSPVMYDLMNSLNTVETNKNNLKDFRKYLESNEAFDDVLSSVKYSYSVSLNIYTKDPDDAVIRCDMQSMMQSLYANPENAGQSSSSRSSVMSQGFSSMQTWQEMLRGEDGSLVSDLFAKQYDILYGRWPEAYNEVVLFVNNHNEVSDLTLYTLGLKDADEMREIMKAAMKQEQLDTTDLSSWSYEEVCDRDFRLLLSADLYQKNADGTYTDLSETDTGLSFLYESENAIPIRIVGIARQSEDAVSAMMQNGVGYTAALTEHVIAAAEETEIVKAQLADEATDVISGLPFPTDEDEDVPAEVKKEKITAYFAKLNNAEKAAIYTDIASKPTDEYLEAAAQQFLAGTDRASLEQIMISGYAQEMGTDDEEAVAVYIRQMDDETISAYAADMAKQQAAAQYADGVQAQLGALPTDSVAAMLDSTPFTDEQYASFYDEYLPQTVSDSNYDRNLRKLGYVDAESPSSINLYAATFSDKDKIADLIKEYNDSVDEVDQIQYTDYVALMMSSVTKVINAISYVLIAFVAISLVVSSIMIGIITYISVLERTKEIGILRAIGASKRDISRVFNAETLIVGFAAGAIGIGITLLLLIPINLIIHHLTGIMILSAQLPVAAGCVLVLISMFLTFIAGLVPSGLAAKKDPVVALRTE